MTSGVQDSAGEFFSTESSIVGKRLIAAFSGCLDMETTSRLKSFLDPLIRDVQAGIIREFEFDTSRLYLMSSASISCLATWIKSLKLAHPKCYVLFKTNPNLAWQRRALDPIQRMAAGIVAIE